LIAAVTAAARDAGTRCIWLETSNLAWPAIQFYRKMGFELCGLDQSLYDPAGTSGNETALYFMLPLGTDEGPPNHGRTDERRTGV
jgi:ribosomal protein S18 acetylase RimI-like enzyme